MALLQALLLGAVQGVTEFLPISSDGHLALAEWAMGVHPSLAFNVLLHAGTLAVVVVALRREVVAMVRGGLRLLRSPRAADADARLALHVLAASVPTAVIGLALRDVAEAQTSSPRIVAAWLAVTGVLLLATIRKGGERPMDLGRAIAVGVAQGLAVLPGLSRSGATIAVALLCRVESREAARFSFAASIPAIVGALALELPKIRPESVGIVPAVLGVVTAAATGAIALRMIFAIVKSGRTWAFALYLFPLAGAVWLAASG